MISNENENITKLKLLSDKLCKCDFENGSVNYKQIIDEIINIIAIEDVASAMDESNKVKCYENMCSKIKIILKNFKTS